MSHFAVLVTSHTKEDVERLLAPYDENESVPAYWVDDDVAWERKYYLGGEYSPDIPTHMPPKPAADCSDEEFVAWYNQMDETQYRVHEGKVQRLTTYNPDSKWDYWRVGGRYGARLLLKEGAVYEKPEPSWEHTFDEPDFEFPAGYVDQARKGDVDIETMRAVKVKTAEENWAKWEAIVAEHGQPISFKEAQEQLFPGKTIEGDEWQQVRDLYWNQPAVKAAKETQLVDQFFGSVDEEFLAYTRDEYMEVYTLSALSCSAFLDADGWIEPGKMGWFGLSSDTPESLLEFKREVAKRIDALSDDAWLTYVDCHI